ncbi:hypothetical protein KXD40_004988 [Peronospora effusa]|uniref:Coiled-coil domain-containing protein 84 n=1 Tax=Peronospora effusa TaxID=542832 RepID=A0A3M6V760_9STRA|nr:hypothetical protein DD238_003879 [Peronospora effusa]RQM15637.1 hypothetical protein DD237_005744 [Peronospora effusa]UIZ22401.1 hypothetical protein KXD40_004988 [Peronospora effusa]
MANNDIVKQVPYCIVCRHSITMKWRKHVFSHGHQKAASEFLHVQLNRLQTIWKPVTFKSLDHFCCVFCDLALVSADALAHFASKLHRKRVQAFCRHYRCDVDRQIRSQLSLQEVQVQEFERRLNASKVTDQVERNEKDEEVKHAANERVEVFLSSAASKLQEVQERGRAFKEMSDVAVTTESEQESLLGPQRVRVKCGKTVTSSEGILQNSFGRHEGKRVWGGGIVKLRKAEWILWPIDQLVKEEQADQPDMQQTGMEGMSFTHRVTEIAQGEGLSSVKPVSWVACVGNVHTAAVPPWMVQTEEEYKKCNQRKQAVRFPVVATGLTNKADKKRRDVFSELQSKSEYGKDWLPNFGGVWQEGPRSKTKQAFRKAANVAKPSRDRDRARQSKSSPSQLQVQTLFQRVSPANSQAPQLTAGVQNSVQELEREVPSLSPSESKENESKIVNPLIAKKQLLLAQKESLRAKMAAKKRQN